MDIVFATQNPHKLEEISALLGEGFHLMGLQDLNIREDIPEDHLTLEENASQKAWYIYDQTGLNCFADDTGLEVDALDGAPGIFSARYAGSGATDPQNNQKLLQALDGIPAEKPSAAGALCPPRTPETSGAGTEG